MLVCTVYAMFALYSYCGQKLLYADFANKIYHIISCVNVSFVDTKGLPNDIQVAAVCDGPQCYQHLQWYFQ